MSADPRQLFYKTEVRRLPCYAMLSPDARPAPLDVCVILGGEVTVHVAQADQYQTNDVGEMTAVLVPSQVFGDMQVRKGVRNRTVIAGPSGADLLVVPYDCKAPLRSVHHALTELSFHMQCM